MSLPITAFYGGLLALWVIYLTFKVVGFRRKERVSLGAGTSEMGERLIRAHGNAAETVPLFIVLLAVSEGMGTPAWVLHLLALVFLVGRVLHGLHFFKIREGYRLRAIGMLCTIIGITATALGLVGHGLASGLGGGAG